MRTTGSHNDATAAASLLRRLGQPVAVVAASDVAPSRLSAGAIIRWQLCILGGSDGGVNVSITSPPILRTRTTEHSARTLPRPARRCSIIAALVVHREALDVLRHA